jgi:hypothetical protein
MRPRKLPVLAAAMILVSLSWTAFAKAAEVNACEIVAKPASFDHQTVTLQGTATALKETTSRRGNDYTTFKLQGPNGCGAVDIFTWGHPTRATAKTYESMACSRPSIIKDTTPSITRSRQQRSCQWLNSDDPRHASNDIDGSV